jgi:hypothetical protein
MITLSKYVTSLPIIGLLITNLFLPVMSTAARAMQTSPTVTIAAGDIEGLRTAINNADKAFGSSLEINLAANAIYTFTDLDKSPIYTGTGPQNRDDFATGDDALPLLTANFTIHGNGAMFVRQSNKKFRFLQIFASGTLALDHLTLQGGDSSEAGGAILSDSPLLGLIVDHVTFKGNHSADEGGAIGTLSGITVTACQFANNTAEHDAGAISFGTSISTVPLTVTDSTFTQNITTGVGNGGAINVHGGAAVISGSDFEQNAGYDGGAVYIDTDSRSVTIDHSKFIANQSTDPPGPAFQGGGAISNMGEQLTITDSLLNNNIAQHLGGGVLNGSNAIKMVRLVFANNQSDGGSAVYEVGNSDNPAGELSLTDSCLLNDVIKNDTKNVPDELYVFDATGFNATGDWWGTPSGPSKEQIGQGSLYSDKSSPIKVKPFLTAAPALCAGGAPTPQALSALPTDAPQPTTPPCVTSTADYTITIPKNALPAGGQLICSGDTGGLTVFGSDKNSLPLMQFGAPIRVCLHGKGTISFLILGGNGKFVKLTATTEGEFTCGQITGSGIVKLN